MLCRTTYLCIRLHLNLYSQGVSGTGFLIAVYKEQQILVWSTSCFAIHRCLFLQMQCICPGFGFPMHFDIHEPWGSCSSNHSAAMLVPISFTESSCI